MNDSARYRRLREIYHEVCDLDSVRRAARLESLCEDDPALRREVESLLADDEDGGDAFGDAQLGIGLDLAADAARALGPTTRLPEMIGRYRVIRVLGQGGMATVYEAEQDEPQRRVAIKVVRAGVMTPQTTRRFKREAHVLGLLQHPGIANVFDVGMAPITGSDGVTSDQPFIVMELIDGEHLSSFVERRTIDVHDRLRLFALIADAVQHAHQRGVIHRDLKPSNILVTNEGTPRVLDFGIARMVDRPDHASVQTHANRLVGTLAYMSPEQVAGAPDGVDTRSDVYALGVILYELLSGRLPVDVRTDSLPEAARRIRDDEPRRIDDIDRAYRGDLATIVGKALEKDVERRYASAAELALDIRRFLDDEPILARPATTTYLLRKFARRNRPLVAGIGLAVAALLVGTAFATYAFLDAAEQRDFARRQRDEAIDQRDAATAITEFLADTLAEADPYEQDEEMSIRQMLDTAAARIPIELSGQPLLEARLLHIMGSVYFGRGAVEEAERHLERARLIRVRELGLVHPEALESTELLVDAWRVRGRLERALELIERTLNGIKEDTDSADEYPTLALTLQRSLLLMDLGAYERAERDLRDQLSRETLIATDARWLVAETRLALAETILWLRGATPEAEDLTRQTVAWFDSELGRKDAYTNQAYSVLATLLSEAGRLDEADAIFEEVVALDRERFGRGHVAYAESLIARADNLIVAERYEEAGTLTETALAVRLDVFGDSLPTVRAMIVHAQALGGLEQHEEALRLSRRALTITESLPAADAIDLAEARDVVVTQLLTLGHEEEAERIQRASLTEARTALGEMHVTTWETKHMLAVVLLERGKTDALPATLDEIIAFYRDRFGPDHWRVYEARSTLAKVHVAREEWGEAEEVLRSGLDRLETQFSDDHPLTARYRDDLIEVYLAIGRPEEAARIRERPARR